MNMISVLFLPAVAAAFTFSLRNRYAFVTPTARQLSPFCLFASENNDNSLDNLYKQVLENDPEWYREFVVNVLGEEDLLLLGLEASSESVDDQAASEARGRKENDTRIPPSESSLLKDIDVVDDSNGDESMSSVVATEEKTTAKTMVRSLHLLEAVSSDEPTLGNTNGQQDNVTSKSKDTNVNKRPNSVDAKVGSLSSKSNSAEDIRSKNAPTARQERRPATSTDTVDRLQTSQNIIDRGRNGRKDPAVGSKQSASPVTVAKRQRSIDTRASASTANNKSRDDERSKGASPTIETDAVVPPDAKDNVDEGKPQSSPGSKEEKPWYNITSWGMSSSPKKDTVKQEKNDEQVKRPSQKKSAVSPVSLVEIEKQDDYVVLYRDLYTGNLVAENLTCVTRLGYNVCEIPYLQPDALALIIEDKIKRPSRGIPQQWKISPSQYEILSDDVRIVLREESKEALEATNGKKQNGADARDSNFRRKVEYARGSLEALADHEVRKKPSATRRDSATASRQEEKVFSTRRKDTQRRRRRDEQFEGPVANGRQQRRSDNRERIYSGRETPSKSTQRKRGDPPPPQSPLWVDLDTFRDMLRSEAELRVRILGEDWADVVKDESNWRLSLYKEWLWMLHKGVGNPIVPSRSDRARAAMSDADRASWRRKANGADEPQYRKRDPDRSARKDRRDTRNTERERKSPNAPSRGQYTTDRTRPPRNRTVRDTTDSRDNKF